MIVDKILDRKDGVPYNAKQFYNEVMEWEGLGYDIADAMDAGNNEDVQNELCRYITRQGYNDGICEYINSVEWI